MHSPNPANWGISTERLRLAANARKSVIAVAIAILSGGLLMFLVSLPLVCRKIPMNRFYGIRVPAALQSEKHWYDINAYGGRKMAEWAWLIIATGLLGFFVPREDLRIYTCASVPITLVAVLVPVLQILKRFGT